jgi:hypothetical protein
MSKAKVSEIDRLIELASDERPRPSAVTEIPGNKQHALSLEDQKDPRPSMWRVLLQLRVLLPYLSRVLPLLERSVLGTNVLSSNGSVPHKIDTSSFDKGLAVLEDGHKTLSVQLKDQAQEVKFLQEQVGWLSKSLEKDAKRQEEILESIGSLRRLVLILGAILVVAVGALAALVFFRPEYIK